MHYHTKGQRDNMILDPTESSKENKIQEERRPRFISAGNEISIKCSIITVTVNQRDAGISEGTLLLKENERKPKRKDKCDSIIGSNECPKAIEPISTNVSKSN